MPINEIFAPFYAIIHYTSAAKPSGHTFRLYFHNVPTFGTTATFFSTYTDGSHLTGWSLKEVIQEVMNRVDAQIPLGTLQVGDVEMWTSAAGVNTFVGLDPDDYSGVSAGSGAGVAAAYALFVLKASNRAQFRLTLFEAQDAKPQRFPLSSPPLTDDGFIGWFMVRSAVKFVTNDDLAIVTISSGNTGYNRRLARSYGRSVSP